VQSPSAHGLDWGLECILALQCVVGTLFGSDLGFGAMSSRDSHEPSAGHSRLRVSCIINRF
jgi:hypothetical protein